MDKKTEQGYDFGGRIRPKEETPLSWAGLVDLACEKMAFVYQRLSSHEQVKKSIYSLKVQDALADLAKEDGYSDNQIYVEPRDLGISGTKGREEREGLAYLIEQIEAGQVEAIYVVAMSRLYRDQTLIDAFSFGELCKAHNVIIITPHMRLNLRDKMHMRLYRMEVERAADELELMRTRLGTAKDLKARQGFYAGEGIPPGYVIDDREDIDGQANPNHQKLRPYDPHAKVIRLIFRLACKGKTPTQIVRYCRRQGITFPPFPLELETTTNLKAFPRLKRNSDGSWPVTVSKTRSILQNPAYIGWRLWAGEVVATDNHGPLIDEMTFWATQEQFGNRPSRPKRDMPPLPLAGILYCGNHDLPQRMIYANGTENKDKSYQCRSYYRNAQGCCKITARILDDPICEAVVSQCAFPNMAEAVLSKLTDEYQQAREQAASYGRELKRLEKEIENLEHNFLFRLTPTRAAWIEKEIAERRKHIAELASLESSPAGKVIGTSITEDDVELVKAFLADLSTGWNRQPNDLKNAFLHLVLERAVIYHNTATIRVRIIWRTGSEQEILIHRPPANSRSPGWTEAELAIVSEHFETASMDELMAMLPGRTWLAIRMKGKGMGLSRTDMAGGRGHNGTFTRWTKEEDDVLRQHYAGEISREETLKKLDRTPRGIRGRARRLGLLLDTKINWEWVDKGIMVTMGGRSELPG